MRARILTIAILGFGLLTLGGCQKPGGNKKAGDQAVKQENLPVRVETLAKRTWQRNAHAVATVQPWRQVSLRAEAPGRILAIRGEVAPDSLEGPAFT